MTTLSRAIVTLRREFGIQPPRRQAIMDEILEFLEGLNREQELKMHPISEERIMKIVDEQIDFIHGKSEVSRGAGKLALMSVLMAFQEELLESRGT